MTHNDVDCYQQSAPRPQEGTSHTTTTLNSNADLTAGRNNDLDLSKEFNFEGGFMWMALSDGRTFLPNDSEITLLVDSGATEHFVDDELIPELKEKMLNYAVLKTPKPIRAASKQILPGTATGLIPGVITDKADNNYDVGFPSMVMSELNRHIFSSSDAVTWGISTANQPGNPHPSKNNIEMPLQQLNDDVGLCSFPVDLAPSHALLPQDKEVDYTEQDAYLDGVIDHTSQDTKAKIRIPTSYADAIKCPQRTD